MAAVDAAPLRRQPAAGDGPVDPVRRRGRRRPRPGAWSRLGPAQMAAQVRRRAAADRRWPPRCDVGAPGSQMAAQVRRGWSVGPTAAALAVGALLVGATAGHAGQVQQAVPMGVAPISLWESLLAGGVGAGLALVAALLPAGVVRAVRYARRVRPARGPGAAAGLARRRRGAAPPARAGGASGRGGGGSAARPAAAVPRRRPDVVRAARPSPAARPWTRCGWPSRCDAGDARARADRAVRELVEAGGLDRAVLLVVLPTGSGWVNPAAVDAVELLAGGDVATVTVQYDDRPSYQSFLSGGGDRAAEQARALLDALDRALVARAGDAAAGGRVRREPRCGRRPAGAGPPGGRRRGLGRRAARGPRRACGPATGWWSTRTTP